MLNLNSLTEYKSSMSERNIRRLNYPRNASFKTITNVYENLHFYKFISDVETLRILCSMIRTCTRVFDKQFT